MALIAAGAARPPRERTIARTVSSAATIGAPSSATPLAPRAQHARRRIDGDELAGRDKRPERAVGRDRDVLERAATELDVLCTAAFGVDEDQLG